MKCPNCRNFVTAQTFLTGWHLLTFLTAVPFMCIEAVVQKCSRTSCSQKFRKIHKKAPVPESFLIKLQAGLFKQNTTGGCFYVYSIGHTGFLLHLGRFQHCNLGEFGWRTQVQTGSRGFYFPCCSILQRNFPNFRMEILALRSAKSFWGLYFS